MSQLDLSWLDLSQLDLSHFSLYWPWLDLSWLDLSQLDVFQLYLPRFNLSRMDPSWLNLIWLVPKATLLLPLTTLQTDTLEKVSSSKYLPNTWKLSSTYHMNTNNKPFRHILIIQTPSRQHLDTLLPHARHSFYTFYTFHALSRHAMHSLQTFTKFSDKATSWPNLKT